MPRTIRGRQTRPNPSRISPNSYWRVKVTIPFLDSIISELDNRFSHEKRVHFELCPLIHEVMKMNAITHETVDVLTSKWRHLMPEEDNFQSELARWKLHCDGISMKNL